MFKFAALAIALVSVQAFACPDLTGNYSCVYQDGTKEVVSITQEQKNGVTTFLYNGSAIVADNQAYPMADDQNLREATFRAWCDSADPTLLQTQLLGKYYTNGAYYGDLTMNMNFSMAGSDLKQTNTGTLKNAGGEYPLNSELTCTRQ